MCLFPVKVKYHNKFQKYRGQIIHPYNDGQMVPCGKCYECKETKIEEWQIRWHEHLKSVEPESSYFLTLTYNEQNIPYTLNSKQQVITTLDYADVQKFLKRLRKRQEKITKTLGIENPKISYHGCGEYGRKSTKRPHYHLLITNLLVPKEEIEKIWNKGIVHIGENVDSNSIKYILKYTLKQSQYDISKYIKKIYEETNINVDINAFDGAYNDVIVNFQDVIQTKLIAKIYTSDHFQDGRVIEKSFVSKGIGKNYLTPEKIKEHQTFPTINYLLHDVKKDTYKEKPLPRYYKELIFNPKARDLEGKLIKDKYDRYVSLYDPNNSDYENTPRYQRQLHTYKKYQKQINDLCYLLNVRGFERQKQIQDTNKTNKISQSVNHYENYLKIKDFDNYQRGIDNLI